MDMKNIGKWSYLAGLVVAIVAALASFSAPWLGSLIGVLAVIAGLFYMDSSEVTNYGIRFIGLLAVATALNSFPVVGPYVTTIAKAMLGFFAPTVLTVFLVFNYKQAMDWMKK